MRKIYNCITIILTTIFIAGFTLEIIAQDKVKLNIELPDPLFAGTPQKVKSAPRLDPQSGKKRKPFFVPKGTTLLSLNKPITSSDNFPIIGDLEQITDGEKEGSDGYFVELGPGKQYVQIDLGKVSSIYAIVIWHYHMQARVYRDVIVQVSNDKTFKTGVRTVFNNDHNNSSKMGTGKDYEFIETYEGKLIDTKETKGRYIRLYSRGNTSDDNNHYVEVDVYGK